MIIAEYYPLNTSGSRETYEIAKTLSLMHEVILLSPSWCEVSEDIFTGDVFSLSENGPFLRRYFVDPIQVKEERTNIFTALYTLGCKVLEYERCDMVLFCEKMMYVPIVTLLKRNYPAKYVLHINGLNDMGVLSFNVNYPYLAMNIKDFDYFTGNLEEGERIKKYLQEDSIIVRELNSCVQEEKDENH